MWMIFLSCELECCNAVFFRGYCQKLELLSCKDDDHLASLLGFVSDHRVVMNLQVPREALEFAGMLINLRSGKFRYSTCPIFSKAHAKIFREF